jgi:pantoate--beta-alanine ligase
VLPIVRDADKLALSSRNVYLSPQQRREGRCLHESLALACRLVSQGKRDPGVIIRSMRRVIQSKKSAKIDYAAVVDAETLLPVKKIKGKVLIALAVFIGTTRLIDNIVVNEKN